MLKIEKLEDPMDASKKDALRVPLTAVCHAASNHSQLPAPKGGEPERGRSGVVLKAGKNGRRDRALARSVGDEQAVNGALYRPISADE